MDVVEIQGLTPPGGGCPDSDSSMDDCGLGHLKALQGILSGRGFNCEINDQGTWPRLRIYGPWDSGGSDVAEFDNNILVVPREDCWWFAWPWSELITTVTDVVTAASRIHDELGGAAR